MDNLQLILGGGKDNSLFSVYSPAGNPDHLEVYFGLALLEKIERGKNSLQLKLLIARLYNMEYKRKALVEAFGFDLKTIRKWGAALKEGDIDIIRRVFAGHDARRKVTAEVESYARSRFRELYPDNHYAYSRLIREEISRHFKITLSSESLRPFFTDEKRKLNLKTFSDEKKDHSCDCNRESKDKTRDNRKQNPSSPQEESLVFLHHAGVLLMLSFILTVTEDHPMQNMTRQWLFSLLLGAVNIEQSRRLDFLSLKQLTGQGFLTSPRHQRAALKAGGTLYHQILLLRKNAELIDAENSPWYYYDPHGIRYTGIRKLLKGWCGSCGKIARVYFQDFIHTASGEPVFFKHYDNYYDLRERFHVTVSEFAQVLKNPLRPLVFVIDRGIYGCEVLQKIDKYGDIIITWEKGYARDGWNDRIPVTHFRLARFRNNHQDTLICSFDCIRYPSLKVPGYDRIIVRAHGDKKEKIEVAVLVNSSILTTQQVVTAIFSRWLQENDFLYEIRHFGLNQITSYDCENYGDLEEELIEKTVDSNEYIAHRLKRNKLNRELKKLLLKKEKAADKGKRLNDKDAAELKQLKQEISEVEEAIKLIEKKCSKEEKLIQQEAQKLKTAPKQYMDAIRITARNIFFKLFNLFRPLHNNFRDDHVIVRELTQAPAFVVHSEEKMSVHLHPAMTMQPKVKENVRQLLDILNDQPAYNGKKCEFSLWQDIKK